MAWTATTVDNATSTGDSTVGVYGGDHVTLHRLLIQGVNRYFNTAGIAYQTDQLLAEECEVYDFHRVGIAGSGATIRRCYLNSRSWPDIAGGLVSYDPARGDTGLEVIGSGQVFENNISEGQSIGFAQHSYGTLPSNDHDLFAGNISLFDQSGAAVFAEPGQPPPSFTRFQDQLVYGVVAGAGFEAVSTPNAECSHCTVLNGAQGFVMGRMASTFDGGASTYIDSSFAAFIQGDAFAMEGQDDWLWSSCDAFDAGMAIDPLGLPVANMPGFETVDPRVGSCTVYLPPGSPLKRTAADGGDIGASVIFRYVDGGLTTEPLWDPVTGAFPCGAIYPGINDVPGASCRDVHLRLNVGTNGCPIPPEYFEDAGTTLPSDGGSGSDAGSQSSDSGVLSDGGAALSDGGSVQSDGGSGVGDGGSRKPFPDGGDMHRDVSVACGCGAADGATFSFGLLLVFLSRRRVRPSKTTRPRARSH